MILTMDYPSCTSLKTLFFAALLLPLLCSAAGVDDAALKYLLANEASTATITNFTSGGTTYYMVFQNQTEAFVLKAEGTGFAIVSDRAALTTPLKDYLAYKYDAAITSDKIASIKSEYQKILNTSTNCTKPMADLLLNPYQMTLVWDSGDYTGNTYRAYTRLSGINNTRRINITGLTQDEAEALQNKSGINKAIRYGYLAVVAGGTGYIGELSDNLSTSATTVDNTAIIEQMRTLIAKFKTPLAQYTTDHNFMNKYYPGVLYKACTFTSASFATMDTLLVAKAIPSEAELADNLSKSATGRATRLAASGDIMAIVASEQASAATLGQEVAAAKQVLAQYNLSTETIDSKLAEVTAAIERTGKSMTKTEAETLDADFKAKLAAASGFAGLVTQESTALATAEATLAQAQAAIGLAAARMGETDINVNNLNETWEQARVALEAAKAQLAQGKAESAAAVTAATTTLTQVKTTAEGLSPTAGQTDVLIIGFVLLVIIIGIVAFFYTKGQKKEPPVSIAAGPGTPGLKKGTSGIIVERK